MAKEKKINVIGMDVFQTAAVKRNYANVKPLIKERNKMEEKIAELTKNLEIKKAQIAANDQHTGVRQDRRVLPVNKNNKASYSARQGIDKHTAKQSRYGICRGKKGESLSPEN